MSDSNVKLISTSALARQLNMQSRDMFSRLLELGLIVKSGENWELTDEGKEKGGEYKEHPKYGKYIAWPLNIEIRDDDDNDNGGYCSATAIGQILGFPATRVNSIFSELGWINKGIKGWMVTERGEKNGGVQRENAKSGVPYVIWPKEILRNKNLLSTVEDVKGAGSEISDGSEIHGAGNDGKDLGFRGKFEAKHRATDGHYVRSRAEMLIDNWLYMAEIVHAYERRLPVEEEVYCDFYIPTGKVYIEFWGYENDERYLNRKKKKQEIYSKYGFKLIEIEDKDVQNLDDILPKLLLKHGIQSY